jgi:hypothetical protein
MKYPIYLIEGEKGGVGKAWWCFALGTSKPPSKPDPKDSK